jgi:tryptophan synthase alpha chain
MLCTPTSTDERLQEICERANGFVYCVARKGVTGKATALDVGVTKFLQRCRKFTSVPLGLGFGLSQPEHLKTLHGHVEVAIVGSALLRSWEEGGAEQYRTHLMQLAEARG